MSSDLAVRQYVLEMIKRDSPDFYVRWALSARLNQAYKEAALVPSHFKDEYATYMREIP